jgi:signal peptide peptidase-like 2B
MRRLSLFALCLGNALTLASAQQSRTDPRADLVVTVSTNVGSLNFFATSYVYDTDQNAYVQTFTTPSTPMTLLFANDKGCKNETSFPPSGNKQFALAVNRGGCSFEEKMDNAAMKGASAIFILNTEEAAYKGNGSFMLQDMCSVFAHAVPGDSKSLRCDANTGCDTGGTCKSKVCLPFRGATNLPLQSCCMDDRLLEPTVSSSRNRITTVFVNVGDSNTVRAIFGNYTSTRPGNPPAVQLAHRVFNKLDWSSVILVIVAVGTIVIGTYRSTRVERMVAMRKFATGERRRYFNQTTAHVELVQAQMSALPSQKFTIKFAAGMVCASAGGLSLIYLLLKLGVDIIDIFNVWFVIVSTASIAALVVKPYFRKFEWLNKQLNSPFVDCLNKCSDEPIVGADFVQYGVGIVIPLWWFIGSSFYADYAWVLQNVLGCIVCCYVALLARLPSLRVSTFLLAIFFLYDVFMVFISPLFFGESIMMEVATAGGRNEPKSAVVNTTIIPNSAGGGITFSTCARTPGRVLPLLISCPRFQEWPGGAAMLGLGDIMIPSFHLAFALRYDYRHGKHPCCATRNVLHESEDHGVLLCKPTYWAINIVSYALGLIFANAANIFGWTIFGVRGQPALMWINPLLVIPTVFVAWRRGHLHELWLGKKWENDNANSDNADMDVDQIEMITSVHGDTNVPGSPTSSAPLISLDLDGAQR